MKKLFVLAVLNFLLIMNSSQSLASWATTINLLGTWTTAIGEVAGNAAAFTPSGPINNIRITMKITEQQGELFAGNITFEPPYGNNNPDNFTGVLEGNKFHLTSSMMITAGERFLDQGNHKIIFHWHAMNAEGMSGGPDTGKGVLRRISTDF